MSSYFYLKPSSIFWNSSLFLKISFNFSVYSFPTASLCWLLDFIFLIDYSMSAFCLAFYYYLILWRSSSAWIYRSLDFYAIYFFFCSIFFISSRNYFLHYSLFWRESERFSCKFDRFLRYSYFSKDVSEFSIYPSLCSSAYFYFSICSIYFLLNMSSYVLFSLFALN